MIPELWVKKTTHTQTYIDSMMLLAYYFQNGAIPKWFHMNANYQSILCPQYFSNERLTLKTSVNELERKRYNLSVRLSWNIKIDSSLHVTRVWVLNYGMLVCAQRKQCMDHIASQEEQIGDRPTQTYTKPN